MPSNDLSEINREIGRLEARLDAVEAEVGELKALVIKKFDAFETKLDSINDYIVIQRATHRVTGWFITKTMGILTALAGIAYAIIQYLLGH